MLSISLGSRDIRRILCIGAHCDDIEIGCGGALMELARRRPDVEFDWLVLSGDDTREQETRRAAQQLLGKVATVRVEVARFRISHFPYQGSEIKDYLEQQKPRLKPDLVFTHFLHDRHQDHRTLAELTWNAFRDHLVVEYEIPKYEGDLAHPNLFFALSPELVERKVGCLMECFTSQLSHPWFRPEVFRGLMGLRGVECNSPTGYAEAFHARKVLA
jgi:LmbE family N-acetylglucosaminyl deacetylase